MKRLTEKYDDNSGYGVKEEYAYEQTLHIDIGAYYNCVDRLGELEDIEEKLGIDLVTLFKALTSDVYLYHNDKLTKCEQAPLLLCFDGNYCLEYHFNNDIEQVYLKDYGKTWALSKEELK